MEASDHNVNANANPDPDPKKKSKQVVRHPLLRMHSQHATPNAALQSNELMEWAQAEEDDGLQFLYPTLNDPEFALNIAQRREFNDTKYDVVIPQSQKQMETEAAKLCGAAFELAPHQLFVRNFLSVMRLVRAVVLAP